MDNAFNRKLAEAKARRAKMYLRMRNNGMTEIEIAKLYKISRQKVNELINYARRLHDKSKIRHGFTHVKANPTGSTSIQTRGNSGAVGRDQDSCRVSYAPRIYKSLAQAGGVWSFADAEHPRLIYVPANERNVQGLQGRDYYRSS